MRTTVSERVHGLKQHDNMGLAHDDDATANCQQGEQSSHRMVNQQGQWLAQPSGQPAVVGQLPGLLLPGPEVSRVGMRMPEFTPGDPELWFSIVERSFQAAGITVDATKFGYALTAIGPSYTTEVRDIIMNPPAERAYETLKAELIKRLSFSQEHKTRRLLEHEEIGDRKPSQFLRHLRSLTGNVVGDQMLRIVWLSRYIQPRLVTRTADTIDQVADIADAIVEATKAPTYQIAETALALTPSTPRANGAVSTEALELRLAQLRLSLQQEIAEQMTAMRRSIEAIGDSRPSRDRSDNRRQPRPRSRSRSRGREYAANQPCWYH